MSVISNVHTVTNYDAKKSSPFNGQRLSKVTYKTEKETGTKKDSKCVSIPPVTSADVQENLQILSPVFISYLQDCQDKIIRARIDAGATEIVGADISMPAIAVFMEAETSGSRLTKESVAAWFDVSIADKLMLALADKLGVSDTPSDEQLARIEAAMGIYKEKLAGLAGGKTQYPAEVAEKLLRALEFADDTDEIAARFTVRLEKMKEVPTVDMLAL